MNRKLPGKGSLVLAAAGLAVSASTLATVRPVACSASTASSASTAGSALSHRAAQLIVSDPQVDNTGLYAFTSPDDPSSVTMIATWIPFEEPNGGPNFYPFATSTHYNIKIDNDGDGRADITYRWSFRNEDRRGIGTFLYNDGRVKNLADPTLLFRQHYSVQEITAKGTRPLLKEAIAAPSHTGLASMPDYDALRLQAVRPVKGGGKTYVGQAEDPSFLDLRIFDLLYGGDLKEIGHDTLKGYNVNTIVFQVPKAALALGGNPTRNPVIGIWSTTDRLGAGPVYGDGPADGYHQVSRVGNPLVNELVSAAGLQEAFNRQNPFEDHTVKPLVDRFLQPEVPALIEKTYGVPAPEMPRKDLREIFLTGISKNSRGPIQSDLNSQLLNKDVNRKTFTAAEELRLNMAIPPATQPNRLGLLAGDLQGFPNGRRLTDDVVDITLQAFEGAAATGVLAPAFAQGDGVDGNDSAFTSSFPYVALPHTASVNQAG